MPRLLTPFEILALIDQPVTITDVALEGIMLKTDLGDVVVFPCAGCEGEDKHLNFALADDDADASAS